ncbi:MAG TPA: rRNA maturation RNase YbeY [Vicinamibacterales bacterium]
MSPTDQRRHALRVTVADETGGRRVGRALSRWLEQFAPAGLRGEATVALVSDARVRRLNRQFRGVDHATDVLSFPYESDPSTVRRPTSDVHSRRPRSAVRRRTSDKGHRTTGVDAGRWILDLGRPPAPAVPYLGDIVIAAGVAVRQARAAGHSRLTELRILALHGLLHLAGYDHESDHGEMARLERRLRQRAGLREGLIERAS